MGAREGHTLARKLLKKMGRQQERAQPVQTTRRAHGREAAEAKAQRRERWRWIPRKHGSKAQTWRAQIRGTGLGREGALTKTHGTSRSLKQRERNRAAAFSLTY